MSITNDTTLLIKMPSELKGSFQGLCKARGVSVSEELRRFMADEVASAASGMRTSDRNTKASQIERIKPLKTTPVPRQPKVVKTPIQANLELPTAALSAINAAKKRKKPKK